MDGLQSKVEQIANQLDQEKLLRGNLQSRNAELEKIIHELATENRKQTERFESKIDLLIAHNTKQDEEISQLKNKIKEDSITDISQPKPYLLNDENRKMNINDVGDILSDESSPRLPPSSCRQLSTIGHYLDGIYLVANSDTNKIETVYCDFGSSTRKIHFIYMLNIIFSSDIVNGKLILDSSLFYVCWPTLKLSKLKANRGLHFKFGLLFKRLTDIWLKSLYDGIVSETLYGSLDVKTKSVHFYVQRSGDFNVTNSVVPFNVERLNLGGAIDLATGVFTVPVNGIYHFESFGLKEANDLKSIYIALQVNGVDISSSYALDYGAVYRGLSGISASLRLKTGDQVRLFKTTGTLNDEGGLFTHFSGSLIEEDLVLGWSK